MARAWALRNSPHVGPIRRGAGPRPPRRSTFAIVVAETVIVSFMSSPLILRYPHRGFSLRMRRISPRRAGSMGGRPGRRRGLRSFLPSSCLRQRLRVSGTTGNAPPLPGKEPTHRGKEGPVSGAVAGPLPSSGEHPQLMAQQGDLQLPVIETCPHQQAEQGACEGIQEEREHGRSLTSAHPWRQRRRSAADRICGPHGALSTFG